MLRSRNLFTLLSNQYNVIKLTPYALNGIRLNGNTTNIMNTERGYVNIVKPKEANIFRRALKKVGLIPSDKVLLRVSSVRLFEGLVDSINYTLFFDKFSMPNTFNSWFLITELHVWLLLRRAMVEGSDKGGNGRFLRNCIVEAMWSDVNVRSKKLGAVNPSAMRKQIQVLAQQFQAALLTYDGGLLSDDIVLAGALWRRFFEMNCDDYEKIELLVKYTRQQAAMLDSLESEKFINMEQIPWISLSTLEKETLPT